MSFAGLRFSSLNTVLFLVFSVFVAREVSAATYYVATTGADSNDGSSTAPWATFSKAMAVLRAGDTLMIKDGTYYQTLTITKSGISASLSLTVRAENDGRVLIDGQNVRRACRVENASYVSVEGIRCGNSTGSAFSVWQSKNITVKRVSAFNASYTENVMVFNIGSSKNVLLEDCAAYGTGRKTYEAYESEYVTFRRCWGRWGGHSGAGGGSTGLTLYGSKNSTVENCILTRDRGVVGLVYGVNLTDASWTTGVNNNKVLGTVIQDANAWGTSAGSTTRLVSGNQFKNVAYINNEYGINHGGGDPNMLFGNITIANTTIGNSFSMNNANSRVDSAYKYGATVKNSSFFNSRSTAMYVDASGYGFTSFTNSYNNYYGNARNYGGKASRGASELLLNPNYDTRTYGKGAYLMIPSVLAGKGEGGAGIGAEVLYRYQDGVPTGIPLWPWPMEDRIFRETGVSVTWEANGGLWKTLDGVYGSK